MALFWLMLSNRMNTDYKWGKTDMNTQEFIEKIEQDAKENDFAILEKIQAVGKNPEAVYAIAKEAGVTDSFEVFEAEMTQTYEAKASELSEEELLAVAGGLSKAGGAATVIGAGVVSIVAGASI